MQLGLTKDELKEYVAMVVPYSDRGDTEEFRHHMKKIFGLVRVNKNILDYGIIDYLNMERKDTIFLIHVKEAKKIGAMFLTWRLEGKKHLIDLAPKWYCDVAEEMDESIPEHIKNELEGCKYYAKV